MLKTYMMQLIYGVLNELKKFEPKMEFLEIEDDKIYQLEEEIIELERQINNFLKKNKGLLCPLLKSPYPMF